MSASASASAPECNYGGADKKHKWGPAETKTNNGREYLCQTCTNRDESGACWAFMLL